MFRVLERFCINNIGNSKTLLPGHTEELNILFSRTMTQDNFQYSENMLACES